MLGTRGSRREERSDVLEGSQDCFLDIFDCLAVQVLETETDRTVIDRLLVQLPPFARFQARVLLQHCFFLRRCEGSWRSSFTSEGSSYGRFCGHGLSLHEEESVGV